MLPQTIRNTLLSTTATIVLGISALTGGGCESHAPVPPQVLREPAMAEIQTAFEKSVNKIKSTPDEDWYSGWVGNVFVNWGGGDRRGLCYEWQARVYEDVLETVRAQGWEATGIAVNVDVGGEHHAVLVWNPRRVRREYLLLQVKPMHGYVLDAWRRAEPDIYRLEDWVEMPWTKRKPPVLEDLWTEMMDRKKGEEEARRNAAAAVVGPGNGLAKPVEADPNAATTADGSTGLKTETKIIPAGEAAAKPSLAKPKGE